MDEAGFAQVKWMGLGYPTGREQGREGDGRLQADSRSLIWMTGGW